MPTDTKISPEESEELWAQAKGFDDLCELMARYVEGNLQFCPTYGGPLDEESDEIQSYLAAFNRAGFLTTFSQPAFNEGHFKQRAAVGGFALPEFSYLIERVSITSDLLVVNALPGYDSGYSVPVTLCDFRPGTWAGHGSPDEEIEHFEDCVSEAVFAELRTTHMVTVIDLCWGRKDYLWEAVAREICMNFRPAGYYPDM